MRSCPSSTSIVEGDKHRNPNQSQYGFIESQVIKVFIAFCFCFLFYQTSSNSAVPPYIMIKKEKKGERILVTDRSPWYSWYR